MNELEQRIARLEQQLAHAMQLIDDLTYDTKIPDVEDRRERRVAIEKYKAQGMSGNAARKAAHREMYRR